VSPITRDPSTATGSTGVSGTASGDVAGPVAAGAVPPLRPDDGRSTRWEDHREARRAELVRVARRVVHHTGPDVSMDDIATAAGTSKSIVYRYFTDKDGLQLAVAAAVVADIRDALDAAATGASTPRDALRGMVDTYLAMIESSPHVYAFVTRGGSVGHFLDSVTALVAAPFVRALGADGGTRPDASRPDASGPDASGPDASGPDASGPDASGPDASGLWAAGAVGFVRGAGERWLAARDEPGGGAPDRADVATQVTAWLWAGPVGLLSRTRAARPADGRADPPAAPDPSRVDDDAPTPGEPA